MSYQLGSAEADVGTDLYAEPRDREAGPRLRGLVAGLVAILIVGIFAGGLWFAYQQGLKRGGVVTGAADVPLIRADERPTKVKPENPGGMEVPDRDKLIYTQKRAAVEHLLPPPEKPMARPGASPAVPASDASQPRPGSGASNAAANAPPGQPAQAPGKPGPARANRETGDPAKVGRVPGPTRHGAQRGGGTSGVGSHQAGEPRPAREYFGYPRPRRSTRQGHSLPSREQPDR